MSIKTEKSIVSKIVDAILLLLLLSGITLVILKAAGYIDWSWWVVLIPFCIFLFAIVVFFAILVNEVRRIANFIK